MAEEQGHAGGAATQRGVERAGHVRGCIGFDFAERMLRSGEDHRLAETGERVGQRRRGVAHRVSAVQDDKRVRFVTVGIQVVNHRLPVVRGRV